MSVGAVGGAGGAAGAGASGAAAAGNVGASAAAGGEGAAAVGPVDGAGDKSGGGEDTKAVEMTGDGSSQGYQTPQMSTQDFCALRTQAAQPVEENQGVDLQKLLEWLMAIKMLEAMGENGGNQ